MYTSFLSSIIFIYKAELSSNDTRILPLLGYGQIGADREAGLIYNKEAVFDRSAVLWVVWDNSYVLPVVILKLFQRSYFQTFL